MAKKDRLARRAKAQQDNIDIPVVTTTEEVVTNNTNNTGRVKTNERALRKQAEAEATQRREKAIAAGTYYSEKSTPTTPVVEKQVIETVSTPGFEETSLVKSPDSNRTLTSASDVMQTNKDVSSAIESGNVGKMAQFGISPKFSDEQIDAQIKIDAQKIADADKKIEGDAAIAKLEAGGDSQIIKSINQAEQELKAANSSVADETMKNALGVDSPISPAIAKTLEESKTTDRPVEVTTKDIKQYTDAVNSEDYYSMTPEEQRQLEAYSKILNDPKTKVRKSEPALEKLGVPDYYPDMNQGIQEGSYSGSIVGSIPIYTAKGGVLPIGVFDARKRAVEAAAVEAKKQKADLIELMKNKTAPQYQQAADNLAFAAMDEALNLSGGDVSVLMDPTNPIGKRFQRKLNMVNNIKAEALWLEERGQELLKAINNEQMYVPNESKEVLKQWLSGNYSMEELMTNPKALKEFHDIYNKLKINDNETYVIGKHIDQWQKAKKIEPMIADWGAQFSMLSPTKQRQLVDVLNGRDYDLMLQLSMEYMPGGQLEKMINSLYQTGEFTMKKEDVLAYASQWFGTKILSDIKTIANNNYKYAELRQRQRENEPRITLWENVSLTTQSPEARGILGNINNLGVNGALNALNKTTNGLTSKVVDGKIVLSHEVSASEKNVKKVPIKTQIINGKSYDQFVKDIPLTFWGTLDYDKVKPEDRRMAEFIISNKSNPDALVNTYTTGYETRYYVKDRSNNDVEVTVDQLETDPSLANRVFAKTDKNVSISADVETEETYEEGGEEKVRYKQTERALGGGKKTYNLQNYAEILELDSDTKQGTLNTEMKQITGKTGEVQQRTPDNGGQVLNEEVKVITNEPANGPL